MNVGGGMHSATKGVAKCVLYIYMDWVKRLPVGKL